MNRGSFFSLLASDAASFVCGAITDVNNRRAISSVTPFVRDFAEPLMLGRQLRALNQFAIGFLG